jgi:hypothetical protein
MDAEEVQYQARDEHEVRSSSLRHRATVRSDGALTAPGASATLTGRNARRPSRRRPLDDVVAHALPLTCVSRRPLGESVETAERIRCHGEVGHYRG